MLTQPVEVDKKIVLVDEPRLTSLVFLWSGSVSVGKSYQIKQADELYDLRLTTDELRITIYDLRSFHDASSAGVPA